MRDISKLNPALYKHYYLTEETSEVVLKFNTSSGLIDVDHSEYDLFTTDAGTLIAFLVTHQGYQNYIYFSGLNKVYFQNCSYEKYEELFDRPKQDKLIMYSFMKSVEIPEESNYTSQDNSLPEDFVRCDYNKFGSRPFYPAINPIAVTHMSNVLDICGIGHLVCIFTNNTENPNPESQSVNTGGRTLSGALKNVYEWAEVHKEPFNNQEDISKIAYDFLEELQIPEEVMNQVIAEQVDMRVSRYLQGESRRVYAIDENIQTPELLKIYFKNKCKYNSLHQLLSNHPRSSQFPSSIAIAYKNDIENRLYQIYIENDLNVFTPEFLKQYFETNLNKDSSTVLKLLKLLEEIR
jgi:hypothetical protein